jgi:hypothetical protein
VCEFEGKTYREGERMYPTDSELTCYRCLCTNSFESAVGVTVNKDCQKLGCKMELAASDDIRKKCVPSYHTDVCCPYTWKCPSKNDAIIPGERKNDPTSPKCKFGNLELEIGDTLALAEINSCVKCTCDIPPMLSCRFDSQNC